MSQWRAQLPRVLPPAPSWFRPFALLPLLGVVALLLAAAPLPSAAAAEREYDTVLALGAAAPLASEQGLPSLILHVDHESDGHYGAGTLRVLLETVELTAGMTHPVGELWEAGYQVRAVALVEGYGEDLYRAGERLEAVSFLGDSLAGALTLGLGQDAPWRVQVEAEALSARFRAAKDTRAETVLPPPFHQQEARLRLRYAAGAGVAEAEHTPLRAELVLASGRRTHWRPWSLDAEPGRAASYRRETLTARAGWDATAAQHLRAVLSLLSGERLDVFSGFRVGGFTGQHTVAGYYRNEFRARRGAVLNLSHEVAFADDRKLTLLADGAHLERLELGIATDPRPRRTLLGVGIGYFHALRSFHGLPLIVRYGQGLRVPAGSPEGYRRELLLAVAAAF